MTQRDKDICTQLAKVVEKYPGVGVSVRLAIYDILDENYLSALMHVTKALSHLADTVNIWRDEKGGKYGK